MGKLSKKERKSIFENLDGRWMSNKATLEYADPVKGHQTLDIHHLLKLTHVDPGIDHALYKCLQFVPNEQMTAIDPVATNAKNTIVNNHTVGLQGVVVSYDRNHGQVRMEIADWDDKSSWKCKGDGKKFLGTVVEFGLNIGLQNDKAFGGGCVGGFALKKLKNAPKGFENLIFDDVYKLHYNKVYPPNDN